MHFSKVWVSERKHDGRSGHSCLCAGFGDYCRVAAVQRCGADLLYVQSGDPQTGTRPFYSQFDVLQPVAERVQHATNSDRAHHHGPPRGQRFLSNCGFPRHFSHHKLHVDHGSS